MRSPSRTARETQATWACSPMTVVQPVRSRSSPSPVMWSAWTWVSAARTRSQVQLVEEAAQVVDLGDHRIDEEGLAACPRTRGDRCTCWTRCRRAGGRSPDRARSCKLRARMTQGPRSDDSRVMKPRKSWSGPTSRPSRTSRSTTRLAIARHVGAEADPGSRRHRHRHRRRRAGAGERGAASSTSRSSPSTRPRTGPGWPRWSRPCAGAGSRRRSTRSTASPTPASASAAEAARRRPRGHRDPRAHRAQAPPARQRGRAGGAPVPPARHGRARRRTRGGRGGRLPAHAGADRLLAPRADLAFEIAARAGARRAATIELFHAWNLPALTGTLVPGPGRARRRSSRSAPRSRTARARKAEALIARHPGSPSVQHQRSPSSTTRRPTPSTSAPSRAATTSSSWAATAAAACAA